MLRVELRIERRNPIPRLSPPALQRRCAPSPAGREPQAPDSAIPTSKMAAAAAPLRLSAQPCYWLEPGGGRRGLVESAAGVGVELQHPGAWSGQRGVSSGPRLPGASRSEKTSPLGAAAW